MPHQKGFVSISVIGVLVIIGLLVGGVIYIRYQPKSAPEALSPAPSANSSLTDEWQTYKNDVLGMTFQYPASHKLEKGAGSVTILSPNLKYSSEATENPDSLVFSIAFTSASEYSSFDELKSEISSGRMETTNETLLGGEVKAMHAVSTKDSQGVPVERYEFLRNDKIFYIRKYPHPTTRQSDFDKIIDSLKFYQPTASFQSAPVLLKNAWDKGSSKFSDTGLSITFDYPKDFESKTFKTDEGKFSAAIATPDVPIEKRGVTEFDFKEFGDNTMRISINEYSNDKKLPLFDFIANQNKSYPGGGVIEAFETYKKYLKPTTIPKEGSFVFEGNISENPRKEVYFEHNGKVYLFGLGGGNDTGAGYTEDADKVFNAVLKSIKFL